MMANRRDAVLDGALEAARLLKELGLREKVEKTGGFIDVYAWIAELNVPLLFKKLDGLLGAYIPSPSPGILVTTERQLPIQRYTAAHELGHFFMKHAVSLDDEEILHRSLFVDVGDYNEVAADTFAAMFLMPNWLLKYHAEHQDWGVSDLADPKNIYQLSLRFGTSYEATCRVLNRHKVLNYSQMTSLLQVQPKEVKKRLLEPFELENWRPNVWVLTEKDSGLQIHGEPDDLFIVRVKENSGAGYLWDFENVRKAGFELVSDERKITKALDSIGGAVDRVLTAKAIDELYGTVELVHARPWEPESPIAHISFSYDVHKERGMSRYAREREVAA